MVSVLDTRVRSAPAPRPAQAPAQPSAPARPSARRVGGRLAAVRSRVYLPAFSIVAIAAGLVAIGWADRWGGSGFGPSMTGLRLIVIGPTTLAIIGVFLVTERVRPAQRRALVARGHRQDLLFTVFNVTLVVPLITALSLSFSEIARRSLPWIVLPRI